MLTNKVGAETKTLELGKLSVELSFASDAVQSTAILSGEAPQSFEATKASGDAGVYTAEATFDSNNYWSG